MSQQQTGPRKVIVVTGASDGIGAAAARRLVADGHRVVVVGRSPNKTAAIGSELGVDHLVADFARLSQVRRLAADLLELCPRIDVLANNAGLISRHRTLTEDGHERTFQVNYLAPFLLTSLLLDRLIESRATVIATSSAAHLGGRLKLDDLDLAHGYRPMRAYSASKLAQVLHTRELARRYGPSGLASAAFHPGVIASSFASSESGLISWAYTMPLPRRVLGSPASGADTLVFLAESTPGQEFTTGGYYVRRRPARMNPLAGDAGLAGALWERSVAMIA